MVTPYLLFNGACKEAMAFYETALGGLHKTILLYGDYTLPNGEILPQPLQQYVMHGEMEICGTKFWFADDLNPLVQGNTTQLTLQYQTEQEAKESYTRLLQGGKMLLEPTPQYYCAIQAAVADRYGNGWQIIGLK